jgi:DNA-binding response OmpR family regulator
MAKKILIVEDDELIADAYRMRLTHDDEFSVQIATSAEDCDKKLQSSTPDLIILDILMPGVDGFELLEKWHKSGLVKKIPVVVATNLNNVESINKALALGARTYFVKSNVLPDDLVKHCQQVLSGIKPDTDQLQNRQ